MLKTVEVVFDGEAFVPTEPVDLPTGTKLTLAVPEVPASNNLFPKTNRLRPMTDEEKRTWERLCRLWEEAPLPFSTVEEALAYSRGRAWPELLLAPEPASTSASSSTGKD